MAYVSEGSIVSIWMEIHCDTRIFGATDGGSNLRMKFFHKILPQCCSHRNENISGMTGSTREDLVRTIRVLEKEAKVCGWVKTRKGWTCPDCRKYG